MAAADRECMRLCLNGHPDAYRLLVERYEAALRSFLSGRLGSRERAEDVAQEAFVRAYFRLGRLRRSAAFFPWLLGIARRVVRERQRSELRYRNALQAAPPRALEPPVDAGDPALEHAIAGLPAVYAEVILLRYYGQRTCAEVAEVLGVPVGTVTKRLSRGHQMLRAALTR